MTIELNTLGTVIKATYEAEPNTNAFTDSEKTKLANLNPSQFSGSWNDLADKPATFPSTWATVSGKPAYIAAGASRAAVVTDLSVIPNSAIGAANGVAPLDAASTIPNQYLNVSGLTFLGGWNADSNFPALIDGAGETGDFYKTTTAGTHDFGNGAYTFAVGDWVMYAGGTWQRIGVQEQVQSVNGKIGPVVINAADVGALPSSYVPAWADVSGKPATATRWPTYAEVTGKPRNYVHRGTISAPIAAVRRNVTNGVTLPDGANHVISNFTAEGYDVYSIISAGRDIVIPSWATHARIHLGFSMGPITPSQRAIIDIRRGGTVYARASSNGVTDTIMALNCDTGILPVSAGDIFTCNVNQNGVSRGLNPTTFVSVELFETIP